MSEPHNKIIADAAKSALGPLGFLRKGRSRTWIADHGWWATIVEFQPSAWSKGSYLNVAAHWLWSGEDDLSFDFGGRCAEHVKYLSDAQFTAATAQLAETAADKAQRLSEIFISLSATAIVLHNEERKAGGYDHGGWMAYHAGVAAGLMGLTADAVEMFAGVLNGFAPPNSVLAQTSKRMSALVSYPENFRAEVRCLIERHRAALRLPALPMSPL